MALHDAGILAQVHEEVIPMIGRGGCMKLLVDLLEDTVERDIGLLAQLESILSMALALLCLRHLPPLKRLGNWCRVVVVNDVHCFGLLTAGLGL